MKKYYTYILLTEQNTLYCGYTDNVEKRFQAHLEGKGAKYTRAHKPIKVVYQKEFPTKSEAMKEEARIKSLSRYEKLKMINFPTHKSFNSFAFCFHSSASFLFSRSALISLYFPIASLPEVVLCIFSRKA